MIDTHTHLYDIAFENDFEETLQRAEQAGVTHFIFPDTDSSERDRMLECAAGHDNISVAVGLHPTSVDENWKSELSLVEKALSNGQWCAIGEIGIDGPGIRSTPDLSVQSCPDRPRAVLRPAAAGHRAAREYSAAHCQDGAAERP